MCGLLTAWHMGDVHRMRRLMQRWEMLPDVKVYCTALKSYVDRFGWPKNLDGEYGLNNTY